MSDKKPDTTDAPAPEKCKQAPFPAAGPHARDDLTNYDATPGAGSLPAPDEDGQDTVSS